jgi:hypothetical protein
LKKVIFRIYVTHMRGHQEDFKLEMTDLGSEGPSCADKLKGLVQRHLCERDSSMSFTDTTGMVRIYNCRDISRVLFQEISA